MPEISIVIPTYNREDLLARAMRSVREQTFQDWEMIVVDDGSTDNTGQIVQSWAFNDKRIKYYRLSPNSGTPVIPRNVGVARAQGEYVAFLDSDDQWEPGKLETQLWYMKYHNSLFTYHDLEVLRFDYRGIIINKERWGKMSTCHSDSVFKFLLRKNFIATSTVMMRRGLYEKYGGMDYRLAISHDWDLWLRIAYDIPVHYINEPLGTLEIRDGSVIGEVHRRRSECRQVIRKWMKQVDTIYYKKIMRYYYLMEVFDVLPVKLQGCMRSIWYKQDKYQHRGDM